MPKLSLFDIGQFRDFLKNNIKDEKSLARYKYNIKESASYRLNEFTFINSENVKYHSDQNEDDLNTVKKIYFEVNKKTSSSEHFFVRVDFDGIRRKKSHLISLFGQYGLIH